MGIHSICGGHMLTTEILLVCSEIGTLTEEIVVDNHRNIGAQLLVVLLVVNRLADWLAELEVGICLLICHLRAVDFIGVPSVTPRCTLECRVVVQLRLVAHLTAYAVVVEVLCTPTHLHTVLRLIEPAICQRSGACKRCVTIAVFVAVVLNGAVCSVRQDNGRKTLILRYRHCRREVDLGFEMGIEIYIEEESLLVGRLAMFEVNLTCNRLVTCGNRRNALRYLN